MRKSQKQAGGGGGGHDGNLLTGTVRARLIECSCIVFAS